MVAVLFQLLSLRHSPSRQLAQSLLLQSFSKSGPQVLQLLLFDNDNIVNRIPFLALQLNQNVITSLDFLSVKLEVAGRGLVFNVYAGV